MECTMKSQNNLDDFIADFDYEDEDSVLNQRYAELDEESREISWNEMPKAWY